MEFSPATPPTPYWRRPAAIAGILALVAYAAVLIWHVDACAGGSDSSGYLNHARLLAGGHVHVPMRPMAGLPPSQAPTFLYTPLGFKEAENRESLVPTYASGLPLMIVAALPFGGWAHAADVVLVGHALAGILILYALGRALRLTPRWSFLGASILAVSPLYLDYSLQLMSDVPAMVWTTVTVLAAWKARERPLWAVASGAALAVAVLIRPNNVLMTVPVAAAWWPSLSTKEIVGMVKRGVLFVLGGVPGGIFFCLHSHSAYGSFFTTGYGDTGGMFSASVIDETLANYGQWLPVLLTPIVWLAVALPFAGRATRRASLCLALWIFAYLAFYVSYLNTHETWWYLRFILPAIPALILGGLMVARRIGEWAQSRRPIKAHIQWAAFAALLTAILLNGIRWDRKFQVLEVGHGEAGYRMAMDWVKSHVPSDAVLAVMQTSGAVFYYTDFPLIRWDQLDPALFKKIAAVAAADHQPIYAPLYHWETDQALKERMPGHWTPVGDVRDVTIWRFDGP